MNAEHIRQQIEGEYPRLVEVIGREKALEEMDWHLGDLIMRQMLTRDEAEQIRGLYE
jgi:hypothetical protein